MKKPNKSIYRTRSGRKNIRDARVVLVYDRVNKWGGAERVLLALKKIFPEAPLYTAVCNFKTASWARVFRVNSSFLQRLPLAKTHHELYPWLTPLAFESFDLSAFDLVISVTSAEAKGVITKPGTLHLCYCLTPTRYLWSGKLDYLKSPGFGRLNFLAKGFFKLAFSYLLNWDKVAAQRPDDYLAISTNVAARIRKYYQRDSEVIYPPVDLEKFQIPNDKLQINSKLQIPNDKFFLVVSRLVPYKKIDLVVETFNQLGWPLKVIGVGSEFKKLKKIAKSNVEFLGQLTDEELLSYYYSCRAVICPQAEDFGLVPIEAQACGKPALSFRGGGALETIIEGKTGEFFSPQTAGALMRVLREFREEKYRPEVCRQNAKRFSQEVFIKSFRKKLESRWRQYQKKS